MKMEKAIVLEFPPETYFQTVRSFGEMHVIRVRGRNRLVPPLNQYEGFYGVRRGKSNLVEIIGIGKQAYLIAWARACFLGRGF